MTARALRLVAAASFAALPLCTEVLAVDYRYVRIADSRNGYSLAGDRQAVINNAGTVAFFASPAPGLNSGYYSGVGGAVSTIVTDAHPLLAGEGLALRSPTYNDSGQIAFFADRATADGFRIYRADAAGTLTLIATTGTGTFQGLQNLPTINNSGNVAFLEGGVFGGAYIGNGSGNVKVYGFPDDLQVLGSPSLNNVGTMSLPAKVGLGLDGELKHIKGSGGGTFEVIASGSANGVSAFAPSVINDSGLVVFGAFAAGTTGIDSGAGSSVITPLVTIDGPYSNLPIEPGGGSGGFPTLNNAGSIAFVGALDAGGNGIFTGADPDASRVIAGGTTLFGRTVDNFYGGLSREALNEAGEIAFQAQLLDDAGFSEVVVKAIPYSAQKWSDDSDGTWSDHLNWLGPVPNAAYHDANFTDAITAPHTVTVDGAFTVGSINFDNANRYTIAGAAAITLDDSYGGSVNVLSGSHVISAPLVMPRNTNITVGGGSAALRVNNPLPGTGITLTKSGAGPLTMKDYRVKTLAVNAGTAQVIVGGGLAGTSKVETLAIAGGTGSWSATFDIADSALVVDYTGDSPLNTIADQIKSGYASGAWTGKGIRSSQSIAAIDPLGRTGVGFGEASAIPTGGSFGGLGVDATAVLIRYTLVGDANLDGTVNSFDFNALATNFGVDGPHWTEADFNHDGVTNTLDFNSIAANFNLSLPAPPALGALVPEPFGVPLLSFFTYLLKRKRSSNVD